MKKFALLLVLTLTIMVFISGCTQNNPTPSASPDQAGYTDVTPVEALNMIATMPGLVIIDVSPVFADGHIPTALSYPVGDYTLQNAVPMMDMDKTYLVYCHTDAASMQGAQTLADAGFMNVYRLSGNYDGWVTAGYPTVMAVMMNSNPDGSAPDQGPSYPANPAMMSDDGYIDIYAKDAKALIDYPWPNLVVIDVSSVYADGHLPGALSYYLGDGTLESALPVLDMDKTYLVYCRYPEQSMQAAKMFVDAGAAHVFRLEGDYAAWVDAGYDIEM